MSTKLRVGLPGIESLGLKPFGNCGTYFSSGLEWLEYRN
jgi:hypothetical protein